MVEKMKITFAIGSLAGGGAERALMVLSEAFLKRGYTVTVLTLFSEASDSYEVPPSVKRVTLGFSEPLQVFLSFLSLRRSILSTEPDVVVSFMCRMNIVVLISTLFLKIPVVVCERIDPIAHQIPFIWKWMRWYVYHFADSIVVQTRAAWDYFSPRFQSKVCIIPNLVLKPAPTISELDRPHRPKLIAIGRLHVQKGFDILLRAFARLKNKYPEWRLTILGEGPLREELQRLLHRLDLLKHVDLPGFVKYPGDYLRESDLFVLPSRYEGFPNALCEAMASGLPVISTDCPSGPSDIIRDGIDGLLVRPNDIDALSTAMDHLMSDAAERKRLGFHALEVVERFGSEKVLNLWESLLNPENKN